MIGKVSTIVEMRKIRCFFKKQNRKKHLQYPKRETEDALVEKKYLQKQRKKNIRCIGREKVSAINNEMEYIF